jgi:hypothetical protein
MSYSAKNKIKITHHVLNVYQLHLDQTLTKFDQSAEKLSEAKGVVSMNNQALTTLACPSLHDFSLQNGVPHRVSTLKQNEERASPILRKRTCSRSECLRVVQQLPP